MSNKHALQVLYLVIDINKRKQQCTSMQAMVITKQLYFI